MKGRVAFSHHLQGIHDFSPLISLLVNLPVLTDFYLQPLGKSVHHRSSHSVKSAGNLVSAAAELAAGVKNGKYYLNCGNSRFFLNSHRDSTSVVPYGNGPVVIDLNVNGITEARERFIHRIVHDLIYQMVQTSGGCAADIHSRPLSHRLQALQYLNLICSVFSTHGISSCLMF